MVLQSSSPLFIKVIDEIVSRHPNEVNYSTLNGKKTKAAIQIEQELKMIYGKFKIFCNYVKSENKANCTGKYGKNNGTEKVTNMETNMIIPNNDGSNVEAAEAEVNSENSNGSNNGSSSSNNKSHLETMNKENKK